MIKKEQRDEIMRRVEEYTDQARLWATRSVANQRSETRALVDLVAYLDSITVPEGWKIAQTQPVAARYGCDGDGWLYIDNGSGSDWLTRHNDAEPLYTLPLED